MRGGIVQVAAYRAWIVPVICGVVVLSHFFWTTALWKTHPYAQGNISFGPRYRSDVSNNTLGFGVIYVLTEDPNTWRVQGLLKAADLTGLHLEILVQPHVPDEELYDNIDKEPGPNDNPGSVRAMLNHLNVLETFTQSGYETALIVEDDVDFSVNIRDQMDSLSRALSEHADRSYTREEALADPYRKAEWDILWLGHLGIEFVDGTQILEYLDPFASPWKHLYTTFNNYYEQMAGSDHEQPQQIIFGAAPLATFAYGITRGHAKRLLQRFRVEGIHRKEGTPFDMILHIDCKSLAQKCIAPAPALFHHQRVVGDRSIAFGGSEDDGPHDMSWYRSRHKYTYNVEWSARCNAAHVGEQVENKWQCLPGRNDPF